jgi:hypothetical protein
MAMDLRAPSVLEMQAELAEQSLNEWLRKKKEADDEVNRWTEVIAQLRKTIAMMEGPATSVKRLPASGPRGIPGKKRIKWGREWPTVMGELAAAGTHPQKKELQAELRKRYGLSEMYACVVVNKAINNGELKYQRDRLWLPGQEPDKPMPGVIRK